MTEEQKTIKTARDIMRRGVGYVVSDDDFERVGMSLKSVGIPEAEIDTFMSNNPNYDAEAKKRIHSFSGNGARGIATLIKWAQDTFNYKVPRELCTSRMNLTDYPTNTERQQNAVTGAASASVMLPRYEPREVPQTYAYLAPMAQLHKFVNALYESGEYIQICTAAARNEGQQKWKPAANGVMLSRENLAEYGNLEALQHGAGGVSGIGTINEEAGVWVRVNPVQDANGKTESVSRFGHLLIECDEASLQDQWGAIVQSRLPIDCVISSGGKSLHAWIRVDATDKAEYDAIARRVYDLLERHGIHPDPLCKNAGRFSRLPGMMRGEQMQSLIALREDLPNAYPNISEWLAHEDELIAEAEEEADEEAEEDIFSRLPEDMEISDEIADEDPQLIVGDLISQGDMFVIGGGSKAGKSFCAMKLAAELIKPNGGIWLDLPITPKADGTGYKVYYLNVELKRKYLHKKMRAHMKAAQSYEYKSNFRELTLRGYLENIRSWKRDAIKRIKKFGADFLCVDPIYLLVGNENDNEEMKEFIKTLKYIQYATQTTIIYVCHDRKGDLREIEPRDRLNGSGVIARSYDSLLHMGTISHEFLRAGGIETQTPDNNGKMRYQVIGVRLETDTRESAEYAPMYYWRVKGQEYIEDTSGVLKEAWYKGNKAKFTDEQINQVRTQLGDLVNTTETSQDIKECQSKNMTIKDDILHKLSLVKEPQSVAQLTKLVSSSKTSVTTYINTLLREGKIICANENHKGNEAPLYMLA